MRARTCCAIDLFRQYRALRAPGRCRAGGCRARIMPRPDQPLAHAARIGAAGEPGRANPADPRGRTYPLPRLSELGKRRHPVTRGLEARRKIHRIGATRFRLVDARAEKGTTVMVGPTTSHCCSSRARGRRRVALLLSGSPSGCRGRAALKAADRMETCCATAVAAWLMKKADLERRRCGCRPRTLTLTVAAGDGPTPSTR